ncbi:MAG: phage holin family protein, partial [Candidatus Obscuribacterales bacterium]|nr:phage holin family protein [Candidatus Obscuribacterales bacterium]
MKMTKHILRLLLTAAAFYFVFPLIPGVEFHGNFIHALLAGVLFSILAWIVEFLAVAV